MLDLPKKRPDFVDEAGGGGFWIWDAVGARDWRIEYVRCMIACVAVSDLFVQFSSQNLSNVLLLLLLLENNSNKSERQGRGWLKVVVLLLC